MTIQEIKEKILKLFPNSELEIINDSELHKGHHPEYEKYGVTHIRVMMVSDLFEGKNKVTRHQMIYQCLMNEMKTGELHSLSIVSTLTKKEKALLP